MARIRTIKPEFWTDEKIVQLPFEARLLFIGMWNFADDHGYLWDEPDRLKMQILPSDSVDVHGLIDLLFAAGLLEVSVAQNGARILRIAKFTQHQKVDKASASKIAREPSRKISITPAMRRGIARRLGCTPGGEVDVECQFCGSPGRVIWHRRADGTPGTWVHISGLELDNSELHSEVSVHQGNTETSGLTCRECNRTKIREFSTPIQGEVVEDSGSPREDSPLEWKGKGMEGNGMEKEGIPPTPNSTNPKGDVNPVRSPLTDQWWVEKTVDHDIDWLVTENEFMTLWNSTKGVARRNRPVIPGDLMNKFKRLWSDPEWRENAQKALAKFPLKNGVLISLKKFLEESTVEDILGGVHDFEHYSAGRKASATRIPVDPDFDIETVVEKNRARGVR